VSKKPTFPRIVLASTSPRRIELLQGLGLKPVVRAPDADETPRKGESPRALVSRLARAKAASVADGLGDSEASLVIAADTIVVAPGGKKILGKPRDVAEARSMLRSLAGHTHTVLTGYCIHPVGIRGTAGARPLVRVITSKVTMRKLSAADIAAYVATGEPMDKAGSYAAQGIGMALIESIRGSYANVVGLPVAQLLSDLEDRFRLELLSWKR